MTSQVDGDLLKIETGPSKVTYKSVPCGHTVGGVAFTAKPLLRERRVDEYGDHTPEMVALGDSVEIKARFAEKTMQVVQTVWQLSSSVVSSSLLGLGKLPGGKGSGQAGELTLHPLDGVGTLDDVTFFKAYVADSGEVQFGSVQQDRVLECTFRCLVDESKADGRLLGQVGVALVVSDPGDQLLTEGGDALLLESGDYLLLEAA